MKSASWRELRNKGEYQKRGTPGVKCSMCGVRYAQELGRCRRCWSAKIGDKPASWAKNEHSIIVKPKKAKPPMESGPTWWVGATRDEFNAGIRKRFHHA